MKALLRKPYRLYGVCADFDHYSKTEIKVKTMRDIRDAYYDSRFNFIFVYVHGKQIGYITQHDDESLYLCRYTDYSRKKDLMIRRGLINDPCADLPF